MHSIFRIDTNYASEFANAIISLYCGCAPRFPISNAQFRFRILAYTLSVRLFAIIIVVSSSIFPIGNMLFTYISHLRPYIWHDAFQTPCLKPQDHNHLHVDLKRQLDDLECQTAAKRELKVARSGSSGDAKAQSVAASSSEWGAPRHQQWGAQHQPWGCNANASASVAEQSMPIADEGCMTSIWGIWM